MLSRPTLQFPYSGDILFSTVVHCKHNALLYISWCVTLCWLTELIRYSGVPNSWDVSPVSKPGSRAIRAPDPSFQTHDCDLQWNQNLYKKCSVLIMRRLRVSRLVMGFCFMISLCLVAAGVWGAAQSGAQGLRGGLDHRHQSASGDPHLPPAGRAAVEGIVLTYKNQNDWLRANSLGF